MNKRKRNNRPLSHLNASIRYSSAANLQAAIGNGDVDDGVVFAVEVGQIGADVDDTESGVVAELGTRLGDSFNQPVILLFEFCGVGLGHGYSPWFIVARVMMVVKLLMKMMGSGDFFHVERMRLPRFIRCWPGFRWP